MPISMPIPFRTRATCLAFFQRPHCTYKGQTQRPTQIFCHMSFKRTRRKVILSKISCFLRQYYIFCFSCNLLNNLPHTLRQVGHDTAYLPLKEYEILVIARIDTNSTNPALFSKVKIMQMCSSMHFFIIHISAVFSIVGMTNFDPH